MTRECYAEAYTRGYDHTVRFLRSRGITADFARDAAQAAWTRGWERISQLRFEHTVCTWVNSIALNLYRRGVRREARFEALGEFSGGQEIDLAAIEMRRVLSRCSSQNRQLLEAHLKGFTTQEIAHDHGVSQTAIRLRLLRARRDASRHFV
jgi:RNA polymerase sigma factor (sigma-70 family)